MSEYIFKLPDLGEGLVEAEIAEWMVKVGDLVEEEDPIGAMLTDKAAVELSAPVSGRVISLAGELGDTIAVGAPLIIFETGDDQQSATDESADPIPVVKESTPEAVATPADDDIKSHKELSDSFSTIVEIDDYSGELLKHENPIHEGLDTELQISSNYRVVDTTSGSVIKTGKVQYVNSQPLNALNKNEINVVMIEEVIQDAYRDISELIVDSLLSIE